MIYEIRDSTPKAVYLSDLGPGEILSCVTVDTPKTTSKAFVSTLISAAIILILI